MNTRTKSPPSPPLPASRGNLRIIVAATLVLLVFVLAFGYLFQLRRARVAAENERRAAKERAQLAQSSPDALAARAIGNYLAKVQSQVRAHEAIFEKLQRENVFSWNVRDRAHLDAERQLVHDFLTTNAQLTDSIRYGGNLLRAEMDTANVPADARDSALALYVKSQTELLPLQLQVRRCDQELGESALDVLELLAWSWGAWRRDAGTGKLEFNNPIVVATFKDYAEKTKAAALAQESAAKALVTYQKQHAP